MSEQSLAVGLRQLFLRGEVASCPAYFCLSRRSTSSFCRVTVSGKLFTPIKPLQSLEPYARQLSMGYLYLLPVRSGGGRRERRRRVATSSLGEPAGLGNQLTRRYGRPTHAPPPCAPASAAQLHLDLGTVYKPATDGSGVEELRQSRSQTVTGNTI